MELQKITDRMTAFLERFDLLDKRAVQHDSEMDKIRLDIGEESENMKAEMEKSLSQYLHRQVGVLQADLRRVVQEMSEGYEHVLASAESDGELTDYVPPSSIEECVRALYKQISTLNENIRQCNGFSFDQVDPPVVYEMTQSDEGFEGEAFIARRDQSETRVQKFGYNAQIVSVARDKKPAEQVLYPVFVAARRADKTCENFARLYRRGFGLDRFNNLVLEKARQWIADEQELRNDALLNYKRKLIMTQDDVVSETFFDDIHKDGAMGKVNIGTGADEFAKQITLGELNLKMFGSGDKSYQDYVDQSPVLSRNIHDGCLSVPLTLDLRRCGNVMVNINQYQNYDSLTCDLIHSLVQSFLLSFPAGRLNVSFIELNKSCNFSTYMPLKKYFFGPIVRDGGDSELQIHNLKNAMYDIHDNKISFNRVSNFYEYNDISRTNPQSAHLLVITDFPNEMSPKAVAETLDIIENGNHTGVFTILVNNAAARRSISDEAYKEFERKAEKNALVLSVENDTSDSSDTAVKKSVIRAKTQTGSFKNTFMFNDGLGASAASEVADRVVMASDNVKQQVITLKDIWEKYEKDLARRKKALPDASALLSIPIGMRGGEVQTLQLSTTGDGSAHAVVIGGTGSGKSNLLHTIVLSGCYRYSPDEFQIYLVDFKGGVEFKYYEANKVVARQIPHVRLTGLTSEPEDGLAILKNVRSQLRERENMFRRIGVEDIMAYNKKSERKLPRLLVIIDEVQELFRGTERNNLASMAIDIMGELFKKGRAFGINILWASQNVPRVSGIKDEILSQIGNRICLKVNNTEDAEEIGVDSGLVRGLNRPEKGLGVISDTSTSGSTVEFRVAFAENTENRGALSDVINNKWTDAIKKWGVREPLFIVGNDEVPLPNKGVTAYNRPLSKADCARKSTGAYFLELGQDYITGKPFNIPIELMGTKSNLWMAGASFDELRDMMGYALLSAVIENKTNLDMAGQAASIYYVNSERKALGNEADLYYALPSMFPDQIVDVSRPTEIVETLRRLHLLNKARAQEMSDECTPVFLFMHKMQMLTTLFEDNRSVALDVPYTGALDLESTSFDFDFNSGRGGGGNGGMTAAELFREIAEKGPDNGIHIVLSVDKPSTLTKYNLGLRSFTNYALIKGISESDMLDITGSARGEVLNKENVAFSYIKNDFSKFKPYRYDPEFDVEWLDKLVKKLKALS